MSQTELLKYDFAAAANVERPLARTIRVWTDKFCELFPERWQQMAPHEIAIRPTHINAYAYEQAQREWEASLAATIQIRDDSIQGFLVAKSHDLLKVVSEILDQPTPEEEADSDEETSHRELTAVEMSLAELFLEQVAVTLGEAWPRQEPLPISMTGMDPQPKRSRMFAPDQVMLLIGLQFKMNQSGSATVYLVMPKPQAMALLEISKDAGQPSPSGEAIHLETISGVQLELTAELGTATLELGDFLTLASGDIIVLDQKIDDPLPLRVNGATKFRAWPGKQGQHQVVKIESHS